MSGDFEIKCENCRDVFSDLGDEGTRCCVCLTFYCFACSEELISDCEYCGTFCQDCVLVEGQCPRCEST